MRKILIVDDDRAMRKLLSTILDTEGYVTEEADSGYEALKKVRAAQPALVILDYMMPGTTGMDVLTEIKRLSSDIDVIVVTGHGSEKLAVEIMKLGADDYIQKPFRKKDLLDSVHRILSAREEYDKNASDTTNILVVDDNKPMLSYVKKALTGVGEVTVVHDPNEALTMLGEGYFDVMITDIYMPYMSGIELLKRAKVLSPMLDVIMMTSSDEMDMVRDAIRHGASDYINKPFPPEVMKEAVTDVLMAKQRRVFENLKKNFEVKEMKDAERTEFLRGIVEALIMALEARDPYTKGHSERVTEYSVIIAGAIGLSKSEVEGVRHSARLHDLGKIGTEDDHLYKMGSLTEKEKESVARHPELGAVILKSIKLMEEYIPGVKHHHERFDGSGYPDGLKGEDIPVIARIIAVADAFDAMLSSRPYREAMEVEDAVRELMKFKGVQFDPKIIDALLSAIESEEVRSVLSRAAAGQGVKAVRKKTR